MKYLFYLLLFATINLSAQGFKFSSDDQLQQIDEYSNEDKGYIENLPSSYSLEVYVPPIITQDGGTCVGFASLYYGLSISYNINHQNTSYADKYANSFDPYFIYSIINNSKNDCEDGLFMHEAMETLSKIGSKKMFYPQFLSCNSSWNQDNLIKTLEYTKPYKLTNFYFVDPNRVNFINEIKGIINYNIPVIVGAKTTNSLSPYSYNNSNGVSSNGLWSPNEYEEIVGGHAMCVVGYDDYKFGGSFRLANSWGPNFGDNGYLWIKYSDFNKYVKEAYFMEINDIDNQTNYQRNTFTSPRYKGHIYEGQILNGYMHGYGIYSFGNDSFLIGNFNYGSREGWFVFLDGNNDEFIKMIKFNNNNVVDTRTLGFSSMDEENKFNKTKEYFNLILPNKKVLIVNEEPDLDMPMKID